MEKRVAMEPVGVADDGGVSETDACVKDAAFYISEALDAVQRAHEIVTLGGGDPAVAETLSACGAALVEAGGILEDMAHEAWERTPQ